MQLHKLTKAALVERILELEHQLDMASGRALAGRVPVAIYMRKGSRRIELRDIPPCADCHAELEFYRHREAMLAVRVRHDPTCPALAASWGPRHVDFHTEKELA